MVTAEYLSKILNREQLEAALSINGPSLILAGAGSGKTRVITYKIAYMIETGITSGSILAVTFTNKAAKEMKERALQLIPAGNKKNLTITTFHSLGLQILEKEIENLGYRKKFSIYDDYDTTKLMKDILMELRIPEDVYDPYELSIKVGQIKMNLKSSFSPETDEVIHQVYKRYQEYLFSYNALDFNDLIKLPIELFEKHPDILEKYQKRWKYFLVDEYQDTSLFQYKLIKMLAIKSKNISVVGDDDQSIYSWRGASSTNISLFEKDFHPIREIKLEQNYRSTGNILTAANAIIDKNKQRKSKKLWTTTESGDKISFYEAEDEDEEAGFIISFISKLRAEGYEYKDFGILFRMNALSRPIEEAFRDNTIPYKVIGALKFFERAEIRDILGYMRFIANHDDEVALSRIINNPKRGIGSTTVMSLMEHAKSTNSSIYMAIKDYVRLNLAGNKITPYLEDFYNLIEKYKELIFKPKNISRTVQQLVDEIDYKGKLLSETKNIKSVENKMRNISQLIQSIYNYEKNPDNFEPNLYEYLQRISLASKDEDNENDNQVNMLSIHSAKGLEYKIVFVVGVEDGLLPHEKTIEETGTDEEERRLFYVAVTRAREKLFISYPKKRMKFNEVLLKTPSKFIEEIPENLIKTVNLEDDLDGEKTLELLVQKWNNPDKST